MSTFAIKSIEQNLLIPVEADVEALSEQVRRICGCAVCGDAGGYAEVFNPGTDDAWLEGRHVADVMRLEVEKVLSLFDDGSSVVVLDLDEAVFYRFEKSGPCTICRRWDPAGGEREIPFGPAMDFGDGWRW